MSIVARTAGAGIAVAVLVGLPATAGATTTILYGPGPKATYTVQTQPAAGTCHYRWTTTEQPLPSTTCNPGALNPKVMQRTLATTICLSGYTASIRPPSTIISREKVLDAKSYHYTGVLSYAEYDHLVAALELVGDPNDRRNLWVEPPSPGHTASQGSWNPKDSVETYLKTQVRNYLHLASHHAGSATSYLPLAAAQRLIVGNWTTAKALAPRYLA